VSEKEVECWSEPEVARTVTVDVTGCRVGGELPPQPVSKPRLATLAAKNRSISKRRRFLQPRKQKATASAEPGRIRPRLRSTAAVEAEVVTVSVVEATPPDGVTDCGAKLHEAPAGNPEHVKPTVERKPFSGVTETVVVPLSPPVTESDPGAAATVKPVGIV
jgi:hypothetical protein